MGAFEYTKLRQVFNGLDNGLCNGQTDENGRMGTGGNGFWQARAYDRASPFFGGYRGGSEVITVMRNRP